jgi:lipoyl(octanoyl) transferase
VRFVDLGLIPFREAEERQLAAVAEVEAGAGETVFLLEHPPVVTLGRQGGGDNLLVTPEALAERGIDYVRTGRGGNITCHFPGQLVAYPVCRIERRPGGIRRFFHDLEEVVIRTVGRFSVRAGRSEGRPGVWTRNGKIASIGIGVKRWVTFHGFALNVARDLGPFPLITLCGLKDAVATSMSLEAGRDIPVKDVKHVCIEEFGRVFGTGAGQDGPGRDAADGGAGRQAPASAELAPGQAAER